MWELGTTPSLDLHSRLLLPDTHVLFYNLDLKSRRRTEQKARLEFSVCNLGHLFRNQTCVGQEGRER